LENLDKELIGVRAEVLEKCLKMGNSVPCTQGQQTRPGCFGGRSVSTSDRKLTEGEILAYVNDQSISEDESVDDKVKFRQPNLPDRSRNIADSGLRSKTKRHHKHRHHHRKEFLKVLDPSRESKLRHTDRRFDQQPSLTRAHHRFSKTGQQNPRAAAARTSPIAVDLSEPATAVGSFAPVQPSSPPGRDISQGKLTSDEEQILPNQLNQRAELGKHLANFVKQLLGFIDLRIKNTQKGVEDWVEKGAGVSVGLIQLQAHLHEGRDWNIILKDLDQLRVQTRENNRSCLKTLERCEDIQNVIAIARDLATDKIKAELDNFGFKIFTDLKGAFEKAHQAVEQNIFAREHRVDH
jgi:hypothetical protein